MDHVEASAPARRQRSVERCAISQKSLRALENPCGIDPKTTVKWKRRTSTAGSKEPHSIMLSLGAIMVVCRRVACCSRLTAAALIWEVLLEVLVIEPDFERLMMDASRIKGAQLQNTFLAADAHGMPVEMFVAAGAVADCTQARRLVEGIEAKSLLADKGYDGNIDAESFEKRGGCPVIPPRKGRKNPREYDKDLYQLRHLAVNAFLELKRRRGVATRHAKNTPSFPAAVHIRCIDILVNNN